MIWLGLIVYMSVIKPTRVKEYWLKNGEWPKHCIMRFQGHNRFSSALMVRVLGNGHETDDFWCQVSNHLLFNALHVAFPQAMAHRQQSHTMLPVSAPKIERLKVTATEAVPAGYEFDESTNEGTRQILNAMFLRSLGIKEEDPRFESRCIWCIFDSFLSSVNIQISSKLNTTLLALVSAIGAWLSGIVTTGTLWIFSKLRTFLPAPLRDRRQT